MTKMRQTIYLNNVRLCFHLISVEPAKKYRYMHMAQKKMFSMFSRNSEAFASEFPENFEEMSHNNHPSSKS